MSRRPSSGFSACCSSTVLLSVLQLGTSVAFTWAPGSCSKKPIRRFHLPVVLSLRFRFGEPGDSAGIMATLLSAKMNPLGIDHTNFIVCESAGGDRVGFAQIRKLAVSGAPDPGRFDARPGTADFEADATDEAWEDLEAEGIPSGWDSLPWQPGYRMIEERAALQRARRRARIAQAEVEAIPLWALASVHVDPAWRGQGVGSALIRKLLDRHEQKGRLRSDVYLLTLENRCSWYEQQGFSRVAVAQVPQQMGFEMAAGRALSALLGNQLVCMRGKVSNS